MSLLPEYAPKGRPDDELAFPMQAREFNRGKNHLQEWVGEGMKFPPATGRYHLFVNHACGWCHQVLLVHSIKGLEDCVSVSHTQLNIKRPEGWPILQPDSSGNGFKSAFEVYNSGGTGYGDGTESFGSRQLTVPILFDQVTKRVVSNDPAHMCFMLNSAFNAWARNPKLDLYPVEKREEIERVNAVLYPGVNDGVYRCRFARSEETYSEALAGLRKAIAFVEEHVAGAAAGGEESGGGGAGVAAAAAGDRVGAPTRFLCGPELTLADLRAFPHLVRFDGIYRGLMLRPAPENGPENPKLLPQTVEYLRRLFLGVPEVRKTCDLHLATVGYFSQMAMAAGISTTLAERAAIYDEGKYSWMPSRVELEELRARKGLPAPDSKHLSNL